MEMESKVRTSSRPSLSSSTSIYFYIDCYIDRYLLHNRTAIVLSMTVTHRSVPFDTKLTLFLYVYILGRLSTYDGKCFNISLL